MHTNDAALVEGTPSFGRKGHNPADVIEINGDTYPSKTCPATGGPTYYTATKCYTDKGPTLIPPASDTSLDAYVESSNRFEGVTHLVLNGTANTIAVKRFSPLNGEEIKKRSAGPKMALSTYKTMKQLVLVHVRSGKFRKDRHQHRGHQRERLWQRLRRRHVQQIAYYCGRRRPHHRRQRLSYERRRQTWQ